MREWSTLTYVDWFNSRCLYSENGMVPPADFEQSHWGPLSATRSVSSRVRCAKGNRHAFGDPSTDRDKLGNVNGYAPVDWHEFFVSAVGASSALLGLLFVTISINIKQILEHRNLPGRAAGTLGTLLSALVVCSFGLAPGQSNRTLGVEILATGAVVATQAVWVSVGKRSEGDPLSWTLGSLPLFLFPALTFVGGGCSLLAGSGGGLYWILAGIVLAFVSASFNAWVFLVEILR